MDEIFRELERLSVSNAVKKSIKYFGGTILIRFKVVFSLSFTLQTFLKSCTAEQSAITKQILQCEKPLKKIPIWDNR